MISWNLGALGIHAAQPYIAQAMQEKAAFIMLEEIQIPRESTCKVQQEFKRKYPEYECYIAAGNNFDLVADTDSHQVSRDGYHDGRAHFPVITFLHKRVFRPKALYVNWHKPREKQVLKHMAHGRESWLYAMTHEVERISTINIYQATAGRPDLKKRVNTHIQAGVRFDWYCFYYCIRNSLEALLELEALFARNNSEGRRRSWDGTWMQQRRVQNIPSQQILISEST